MADPNQKEDQVISIVLSELLRSSWLVYNIDKTIHELFPNAPLEERKALVESTYELIEQRLGL